MREKIFFAKNKRGLASAKSEFSKSGLDNM
jgi:hypothetical protein